jgi:hypothetical protein
VRYESHQIDTIVREVLRRLGTLEQTSSETASAPRPEPVTLDWDERLVTWARLEPRLKAARHVRFPRRTIVSPLVKDELKQRRIGWSFQQDSAPVDASISPTLLVCGGSEPLERSRAEMLVQQLVDQRVQVVASLTGDPGEVGGEVERLARRMKDACCAVILSKRPWRSACELNRHPALRAAVACSTSAVRQAIDEFQPNVLVFDLHRQPVAELLHSVRTYLSCRLMTSGGAYESR